MILTQDDVTALFLTLKLASITTLILLIIGTPLAWWLSQTKWRFKFLVEAIVALPLVLPPTVLGFYLLIALKDTGLVFTFGGLVVGSVFYSLPFVVQPLQNSFENIGDRALEVASTLRSGPIDRFFTIAVPLARGGFLTAITLGFAHTLGEFGVVLMIGGNIPGSTQVVSIAIYDHVESLEYVNAHWLSAILLAISFVMLMCVYALNRHFALVKR